jgi:hypothetical protein
MNNPDAQFKTCTSAYNCLREMADRIEQADGSGGDWRILFEDDFVDSPLASAR